MKAQRVIYLWRMFEIAMNFDSSFVFGAKGRYAPDEERVFPNDGMQGPNGTCTTWSKNSYCRL